MASTRTPPLDASLPKPWTVARDRFLSKLNEDERRDFEKASITEINEENVERLFYAASGSHRAYVDKSRVRKTMASIAWIPKLVEEYGPGLDKLASAASTLVAPIWGSVRIVLILARNYEKYFDEVVKLFEKIGQTLPFIGIYHRLFPDHLLLTNCMTDAYADIIDFCYEVLQAFKENPSARTGLKQFIKISRSVLGKPVNKKFEMMLAKFENDRKRVKQAAEAAHMLEFKREQDVARANRELVKFDARKARRTKILQKLPPCLWQNRHINLQKVCHLGTSRWLLEENDFKSWRHSSDSGGFACCGIPGAGKSVICSVVIDELRKPSVSGSGPEPIVVCHYCHYADKRSLKAVNIFGSLIRQVVEQLTAEENEKLSETWFDSLESAYADSENSLPPEIASDVFSKAAACSLRSTFVIVDGLDELERSVWQEVVEVLNSIIVSAGSTLKVFTAVRREASAIRKALKSFTFFDIEADMLKTDISYFIRAEVETRCENEKLTVTDPTLKDLIVERLTEGAQGMFLWVWFQLQELEDAVSDNHVCRILDNLPKDLAETFSRILLRIKTSPGGAEKIELARKIFMWTACARRPLTVGEMKEAVALQSDDKSFNRDRVPSGDGSRMIEVCGSLAQYDRTTETVTLAHHTVLQYLNDKQRAMEEVHFTMEDAELALGLLSVTFFMLSDFETQVDRLKPLTVSQPPPLEAITNTDRLLMSAIRTVRGSSRFAQNEERSVMMNVNRVLAAQTVGTAAKNTFELWSYLDQYWLSHISNLGSSWAVAKDLILTGRRGMLALPWQAGEICDEPVDFDMEIHIHKKKETMITRDSHRAFRWAIANNNPTVITITAFGQSTQHSPQSVRQLEGLTSLLELALVHDRLDDFRHMREEYNFDVVQINSPDPRFVIDWHIFTRLFCHVILEKPPTTWSVLLKILEETDFNFNPLIIERQLRRYGDREEAHDHQIMKAFGQVLRLALKHARKHDRTNVSATSHFMVIIRELGETYMGTKLAEHSGIQFVEDDRRVIQGDTSRLNARQSSSLWAKMTLYSDL